MTNYWNPQFLKYLNIENIIEDNIMYKNLIYL